MKIRIHANPARVRLVFAGLLVLAVACGAPSGDTSLTADSTSPKAVPTDSGDTGSTSEEIPLPAAVQELDRQLKTDSSNAMLWFRRGQALEEANRLQPAIGSYRQAVRIQPEFTEAQVQLAYVLALTGQEESLYWADQVLRQTENPMMASRARFIKGLGVFNQGYFAKAIPYFDSCITQDYTYLDAYIGKAQCQLELQQPQAALKTLEQAMEVNTSYAETWFQMGRCYEALGRKEKAVELYEKTFAMDASYTEARDAARRLK